MNERIVLNLSDLRFVSITCKECQTVVTLDMESPSDTARKHGRFAPKSCPGCQRDYDSGVVPAVNDMQRTYEEALAVQDWITFHGK